MIIKEWLDLIFVFKCDKYKKILRAIKKKLHNTHISMLWIQRGKQEKVHFKINLSNGALINLGLHLRILKFLGQE